MGQYQVGERVSGRWPSTTKPHDVIVLSTGQRAQVETVKVADDRRDVKGVAVVCAEDAVIEEAERVSAILARNPDAVIINGHEVP